MVAFNDLSISRKLTLMNVVVIALLLLTTCAAFVGYEFHAFTNTAAEHLATNADIVGIDVTPAMLFNDAAAAAESLAALRATPNIEAAAVYAPDGRMFANYMRGGERRPPDLPPSLRLTPNARHIDTGGIVVLRQIVSDSKPIGMVYVRSDLREIGVRVRGHALIALAVLLAAFALALVVSS